MEETLHYTGRDGARCVVRFGDQVYPETTFRNNTLHSTNNAISHQSEGQLGCLLKRLQKRF